MFLVVNRPLFFMPVVTIRVCPLLTKGVHYGSEAVVQHCLCLQNRPGSRTKSLRVLLKIMRVLKRGPNDTRL